MHRRPRPLDRFAVTIVDGVVLVDTGVAIQRDHTSCGPGLRLEGGCHDTETITLLGLLGIMLIVAALAMRHCA
jgi:hypothetical protein